MDLGDVQKCSEVTEIEMSLLLETMVSCIHWALEEGDSQTGFSA